MKTRHFTFGLSLVLAVAASLVTNAGSRANNAEYKNPNNGNICTSINVACSGGSQTCLFSGQQVYDLGSSCQTVKTKS